MKRIVDQQRGMTSAGGYGNNSDQRTMGAADATIWRRCGNTRVRVSRTLCSDFVQPVLKIPDLSKAEKLDRFVHALVQDIRLQVEL